MVTLSAVTEDWKVRWLPVAGGAWAGLKGNVLGRKQSKTGVGSKDEITCLERRPANKAGGARGRIRVERASDVGWTGLVCVWKAVRSRGQLLSRG